MYVLATESSRTSSLLLSNGKGRRPHAAERRISNRLVDALVVWGDEEAVWARVQEHREAGADHVAVHAIRPDPLTQLRRLAPVLRD